MVLHRGIESRGRFVRNQETRLEGKRDRDQHALPHAARQFMRIKGEDTLRRLETTSAQEGQRTDLKSRDDRIGSPLLRRSAPRSGGRIEVGERILEHHREAVPSPKPAADLHPTYSALGWLPESDIAAKTREFEVWQEPCDGASERPLPAARFTDDPDAFAGRDVKIDAIDRAHDAVAGLDMYMEVADHQKGRSVDTLSGRSLRGHLRAATINTSAALASPDPLRTSTGLRSHSTSTDDRSLASRVRRDTSFASESRGVAGIDCDSRRAPCQGAY